MGWCEPLHHPSASYYDLDCAWTPWLSLSCKASYFHLTQGNYQCWVVNCHFNEKQTPVLFFWKIGKQKNLQSSPVPVCCKKSESTKPLAVVPFIKCQRNCWFSWNNWQRTATVLWKVAWTVLSVYEDCDYIVLRTVSYQLAFQF